MATNPEVAKAFIVGAEKRSGNGNFRSEGFANGGAAWSYGTPVAHMLRTLDGTPVALVTSASYSVTTEGQHIGAIRRACIRAGVRYFRVPSIGVRGGRNRGDDRNEVNHAANVEHLKAEIEAEKGRLERARVNTSRDRLEMLLDDLDAYEAAFGWLVVDTAVA